MVRQRIGRRGCGCRTRTPAAIRGPTVFGACLLPLLRVRLLLRREGHEAVVAAATKQWEASATVAGPEVARRGGECICRVCLGSARRVPTCLSGQSPGGNKLPSRTWVGCGSTCLMSATEVGLILVPWGTLSLIAPEIVSPSRFAAWPVPTAVHKEKRLSNEATSGHAFLAVGVLWDAHYRIFSEGDKRPRQGKSISKPTTASEASISRWECVKGGSPNPPPWTPHEKAVSDLVASSPPRRSPLGPRRPRPSVPPPPRGFPSLPSRPLETSVRKPPHSWSGDITAERLTGRASVLVRFPPTTTPSMPPPPPPPPSSPHASGPLVSAVAADQALAAAASQARARAPAAPPSSGSGSGSEEALAAFFALTLDGDRRPFVACGSSRLYQSPDAAAGTRCPRPAGPSPSSAPSSCTSCAQSLPAPPPTASRTWRHEDARQDAGGGDARAWDTTSGSDWLPVVCLPVSAYGPRASVEG